MSGVLEAQNTYEINLRFSSQNKSKYEALYDLMDSFCQSLDLIKIKKPVGDDWAQGMPLHTCDLYGALFQEKNDQMQPILCLADTQKTTVVKMNHV